MSQQFKLNHQNIEIYSINIRDEKHGPDDVPAFDLHCRITSGNDMLNAIDPTLLDGFYSDGMPEQDGEIKQLAGMDKKSHLRIPKLVGPHKLKLGDLIGAMVTFPWGPREELVFASCKVNDFKVEPKEGGTVHITFKVASTYEPKDHGMQLLCIRHGGETEISIEPAQQELDSDGDHPDPDAQNEEPENPFGKTDEKKPLAETE